MLAIVPVITDQVAALTENAPELVRRAPAQPADPGLDEQYDIVDKAQDYVTSGDFAGSVFGGVLGVGLAILAALATRSSSSC